MSVCVCVLCAAAGGGALGLFLAGLGHATGRGVRLLLVEARGLGRRERRRLACLDRLEDRRLVTRLVRLVHALVLRLADPELRRRPRGRPRGVRLVLGRRLRPGVGGRVGDLDVGHGALSHVELLAEAAALGLVAGARPGAARAAVGHALRLELAACLGGKGREGGGMGGRGGGEEASEIFAVCGGQVLCVCARACGRGGG